MSEKGQLYTAGIWIVKPGKEAEFINIWEKFANWTKKTYPGIKTGRLLQHIEQPGRFVSFGDWASQETIQSWRSSAEFRSFLEKARELCTDIQPGTYQVAAHTT